MRFRDIPPLDIRALPNYTIIEASRFLNIPPTTLKDWVVGRSYPTLDGRKRSDYVIRPAQPEKPLLLSFVNLVEAQVLHAIRHRHGVTLQNVRKALYWVEHQFQSRHPLFTEEFKTDGVDLFIDKLGELFVASQHGQMTLRQAFDQHLERIRYDEEGLARKIFPFSRREHGDPAQSKLIVMDAAISFGRPVISGTGIPTSAVFERFMAGEEPEDLARDYRRPLIEITEVIRCEKARA
jgi:uncharacterized protein (DUF433 family)